MSDPENARLMLDMASKDLRAIRGMLDAGTFDDEIFGFHAQQAVEKAFKAWLSFVGITYPRIHDLEELLALLRDHGESVPHNFQDLVDLNDFAVQFRYTAFESFEDRLDRPSLIQQVAEAVGHVEGMIRNQRT